MTLPWHPVGLAEDVLAASARAHALDALVPLTLHARIVVEAGVPFELLHAPGLAQKAPGSTTTREPRAQPFDPFEPFEPAMFVADLDTGTPAEGGGTSHVLLLNKFPGMPGHVVLVTRRSAPQQEPPTRADLVALAQTMHGIDGLAFYNGGPVAGASQEHKHFQLVSRPAPWPIDRLVADAPARGEVPGIAYRHAFVRHDLAAARSPHESADLLAASLATAAAALGIDLAVPRLAPVNLLATRTWLMLVPRTREHWAEGISINALGFLGLVLARSEAALVPLEAHGVMRALAEVTR